MIKTWGLKIFILNATWYSVLDPGKGGKKDTSGKTDEMWTKCVV